MKGGESVGLRKEISHGRGAEEARGTCRFQMASAGAPGALASEALSCPRAASGVVLSQGRSGLPGLTHPGHVQALPTVLPAALPGTELWCHQKGSGRETRCVQEENTAFSEKFYSINTVAHIISGMNLNLLTHICKNSAFAVFIFLKNLILIPSPVATGL